MAAGGGVTSASWQRQPAENQTWRDRAAAGAGVVAGGMLSRQRDSEGAGVAKKRHGISGDGGVSAAAPSAYNISSSGKA